MTDLTNINLETLNLKNLQTLAKEFKVKSWWTMKKTDLITELTNIRLDLEDKAAVQRANEEYKEELEKMANKVYQEEKIPEKPKTTSTPKKTPKTPKVKKDEENLITLKDLATEFHMKGTKARRLLRDASISRPYGGNRWEWDKNLHVDELNMAREYLKAHTK